MNLTGREVYQKREKPKKNASHLDKVAAIGCIVCIRCGMGATPAEIHHDRGECGLAQRGPDEEAIPLCPNHHRLADGTGKFDNQIAYHHNPAEFTRRYGTHDELLAHTLRLL